MSNVGYVVRGTRYVVWGTGYGASRTGCVVSGMY